MCAVSMIGDDWRRRLPGDHPWIDGPWTVPDPIQPWELPPIRRKPKRTKPNNDFKPFAHPTQEEFDRLKQDVEKMKKQLEDARKQDIAEGNPDCEMEEKVAFIKKIADAVGVDLGNVFGKISVDNK